MRAGFDKCGSAVDLRPALQCRTCCTSSSSPLANSLLLSCSYRIFKPGGPNIVVSGRTQTPKALLRLVHSQTQAQQNKQEREEA